MASKKLNGKRRSFTDEFRAGAVRLVLQEGRPVAEVARDLDLWESVLHSWVRQAKADNGKGAAGVLTSAEKDELAKLRRENRLLKQERDILKNCLGGPSRRLLDEKLQELAPPRRGRASSVGG